MIDNTRNMHNQVVLPPAPLLDLAQRLAVIKTDLLARSDGLYDTARRAEGEVMAALSSLAGGVVIHALELDQIERELRHAAGAEALPPPLRDTARRRRASPTDNPFEGL